MDGRSLSSNGCRPGWLRRPDAHDDADANERNMRRHPPLPLSRPSFPPPSPGIDCRRAPRSPERIRRRKGNERKHRTIYPADYSLPPLPSAEIPYPPVPEAGPTTRIRRQVFAKVCGSLSIRFLVANQRESLSIEIRPFHPENPMPCIYIYICIHRRLGGGFVDFGRRKKT